MDPDKKADVVEDVIEDETLESSEVEETEEQESEEQETQETEENSKESDDEVVITIGDESPPSSEEDRAPDWVRDLRKQHREAQRENRELKEKLSKLENPAPKKIEVGKKPTLEDSDYDTDDYEAKLADWYERKREADRLQKEAEEKTKAEQASWQQRVEAYNTQKASLKVRDFEEAELVVFDTLNQTQQGIIVSGAENSAQLIYALGTNEAEMKKLATITDPVKFAFAVAKLEAKLKVTNRKAPPPEKRVTDTGPKSGAVDSTLERLREEAARTGDYTKVSAYKRQKRKT